MFSISTLGYELLSLGLRVAALTFRGHGIRMNQPSFPDTHCHNFGWPLDFPDVGPFWTNYFDPQTIITILDYLLHVKPEDWLQASSNIAKSIIQIDPSNSRLREVIDNNLIEPIFIMKRALL